MHGRSNESHKDGNKSPGDHDAREPFASAPALDDEAAGNLKEQVADKEDAGAEAEDTVTEVEVVRHFEGGVADVDAVEKRDDEKGEEKRQEAPRDAAARAYVNGVMRGWFGIDCGSGCIHPAWASNITKHGLHANEKLSSGVVFGERVYHAPAVLDATFYLSTQ